MTDKDLSLLTDDEPKPLDTSLLLEHEVSILGKFAATQSVNAEDLDVFVRALIAARAENKRKDDVMAKLIDAAEQGRSLLRQMAEVSSLAGRRGAHERADAIDAVLKEAAALLQSEKGGE